MSLAPRRAASSTRSAAFRSVLSRSNKIDPACTTATVPRFSVKRRSLDSSSLPRIPAHHTRLEDLAAAGRSTGQANADLMWALVRHFRHYPSIFRRMSRKSECDYRVSLKTPRQRSHPLVKCCHGEEEFVVSWHLPHS